MSQLCYLNKYVYVIPTTYAFELVKFIPKKPVEKIYKKSCTFGQPTAWAMT